MALCPKCERALPANGSCLYCGKFETKLPDRKRGPFDVGPYVTRILVVGAIAFGVYWLFMTPGGKSFFASVKSAVFRSSEAPASDWVRPLQQYPKVKELLAKKIEWRIIEEPLPGDADAKLVTLLQHHGQGRYAFLVNRRTQLVTAQDAGAAGLMR